MFKTTILTVSILACVLALSLTASSASPVDATADDQTDASVVLLDDGGMCELAPEAVAQQELTDNEAVAAGAFYWGGGGCFDSCYSEFESCVAECSDGTCMSYCRSEKSACLASCR